MTEELGKDIMPEINAHWARMMSKEIISEKVEEQLKTCLNNVRKAVNRDESSAYGPYSLHQKTKAILMARGFNLKQISGDQRDSGYTQITW